MTAGDGRRVTDATDTQVVIRPMSSADRPALEAMYADFPPSARSHGLPPLREERLVAWLDRLEATGANYVAERAGTLVGHAAYVPVTADVPDFVVFVHSEWLNLGIGTELVDHVIDETEAAGYAGVISYVEHDNDAAIRVYEKVGFRDIVRTCLHIRMGLDHPGNGAEADGNEEE